MFQMRCQNFIMTDLKNSSCPLGNKQLYDILALLLAPSLPFIRSCTVVLVLPPKMLA